MNSLFGDDSGEFKSLSVVIPAYNEREWISRCVSSIKDAVALAGIDEVEIIVIDDGSTDGTAEAESLAGVSVVRQQNTGRWEARLNGLRRARNDFVLLIDSRVFISIDSLRWVVEQIASRPDAVVWNSHVEMEVQGNFYARFWRTVTRIAWRRYWVNPRTLSYGEDDFDYYPKGTTCFLAPRQLLLDAASSVTFKFQDGTHVNDDGHLIREIVRRRRINISPYFKCLYHSRTALKKMVAHTMHRGTVLVEGYFHPGTRYFLPLVMVALATPISLVAAYSFPAAFFVACAAGLTLSLLVALASRAPIKDAIAFMCLLPIFAAVYGLGVWRGLFWTATRRRKTA